MQSLPQILMGDFIIKYTLTTIATKCLIFYLEQDKKKNPTIVRGKESIRPDPSRAALGKKTHTHTHTHTHTQMCV